VNRASETEHQQKQRPWDRRAPGSRPDGEGMGRERGGAIRHACQCPEPYRRSYPIRGCWPEPATREGKSGHSGGRGMLAKLVMGFQIAYGADEEIDITKKAAN
jgi:hypothetical protein